MPTRRGTAILTDVDGTLAPIAPRPEDAAVPEKARAILAELSERYGLVGAISGRRAVEARRLVGVDGIAYAGNHGLELLLPGEEEPRLDPSLEGREDGAAEFVAGLDAEGLAALGLRLEDKGPIQALHWRGAADERAAEARAREIAAAAGRAGLEPRWGRKVLELRPVGGGGKDAAAAALLATDGVGAAVYAGDDRTDLDAFRRLRELREAGELKVAVCVGVASPEAPPELTRGVRPDRRRPRGLAGDPRGPGEVAVPYTDLLRLTVFLTGAEATALGAITAIAAGRSNDTTTVGVAAAWWLVSLAIGLYLGRPARAADGVRDALAQARTATSLPSETPARIAVGRLWPIGLTALAAGVLGIFFPGVAAIGAGYALLVSLAWRTREAAVLGVEHRDGVKFYVVPNSALRPIELVRTPGLRSIPT